jgi:hypothetical protein
LSEVVHAKFPDFVFPAVSFSQFLEAKGFAPNFRHRRDWHP